MSEETLYLLTASTGWVDPCSVPNTAVLPSLQRKIDDLQLQRAKDTKKGKTKGTANGKPEETGNGKPGETGYIYHTQCKKTGVTLNYYIEKKSYVCKFCAKDCFTKWRLARHERTHTGVKPFQCNECGRAFGDKSNLVQHSKVHTVHVGKPFRCDICGKAYSQSRVLKQHVRAHRKNGELDEKQSTKQDYLKGDLEIHKEGDGEQAFQFNTANDEFSHNENVLGHKEGDDWWCDICARMFRGKAALLVHLKNHNHNRLFECSFCGKGFKDNSHLNEHERYHVAEKQWACDLCGKHFTRKGDLNRHLKIHSGERVFQCVFCGKGFFDNSTLKEHLRIHTGGDMLDVH